MLMTVALICTFSFVGNVRAARLLSFVDEQRSWMVGFGSDVYHTEDGGEHWKKQSTPTGRSLHSVFFVDPQHGWAVGDGGTILRTINGGKKWSLHTKLIKADLLDVFFLDADHGWTVGTRSTFARTSNGGKSWTVTQLDPLHDTLTSVAFAHYSNGKPTYGLVVSASGGIFRTRDGGKKWVARKVMTANPWRGVVAVNPYTGVDRAFNYAIGAGGVFFLGYDHNFDSKPLQGQPDLNALDFVDDQVGWVVGDAGEIRKTTDGGTTWTGQESRAFDFEAIQCVNGDRVYALSKPVTSQPGKPVARVLIMTNDGGETWSEQLVPSGNPSGAVFPPDRPAFAEDVPLSVFVPNQDPISNHFILPSYRPTTDEITQKTMTLTACRGEYEPATFAIRSSLPLKNVMVQVSDLQAQSGSGKTIPADAVDVYWIKCWYQLRGFVPELLVKNDSVVPVGNGTTFPPVDTETIADSATLQPLDLPVEFTKQVWLAIHIPDEAGPGEYQATVTVTAKGHEPRMLDLQVRVLPFTLEPPTLDYGLYVSSEMCGKGLACRLFARTPGQIYSLLENLHAHGITHPYVHQPISIKPKSRDPQDPKGRGTGGVPWQEVKYDPSHLRRYLEMMDEIGFPKDKLFWANSYMMNRINYSKHQKVGDPKLTKWPAEAFMPTLNIVTELAKEFGYGEVYFYGMDEVGRQQLEFQRTLFEMMRKADTSVPAKTFCATHGPTDVYDAANSSQMIASDEIRQYQSTGRKLYIYANPVSGIEQPYTYRRNIGIILYKSGADGAGWWADYFTSRTRDFSFIYYTKTGQLDTLQWEGWREGVDDVRYLATLQKQIENFKTTDDPAIRQTVAKAKAWLQNFKISQDAQQVRQEATAHIMALNTTSQR
jgi:photosystem II stability/assembly factor-like uncharacterized protein